ncbi:MAG: hypothetical protein KDE53_35415 [Caldilineaceae bacterium]|nr:hypothetical protein [Caldilineaceae bacterium]
MSGSLTAIPVTFVPRTPRATLILKETVQKLPTIQATAVLSPTRLFPLTTVSPATPNAVPSTATMATITLVTPEAMNAGRPVSQLYLPYVVR